MCAVAGFFSIKDPQDGSGLAGTSKITNLQIAAVGHRNSPGNADLRRIDVTLVDVSISRLRYNEVSMKASHNSYQRDEILREQITWNPKNTYDCGCCIIATNKISDHAWAVVGMQRFAKRVPLL